MTSRRCRELQAGVCVLSASIPPSQPSRPWNGGWATALDPSLAGRGHAVDVLTWGGGPGRLVDQEGVRVHVGASRLARRMPVLRTIENALVPGLDVVRRAQAAGPFDVVIAPEWRGDAWGLAGLPGGAPVVTMLEGSSQLLAAGEPGRAARESVCCMALGMRVSVSRPCGPTGCSAVVPICSSEPGSRGSSWRSEIWRAKRIHVDRVRRLPGRRWAGCCQRARRSPFRGACRRAKESMSLLARCATYGRHIRKRPCF